MLFAALECNLPVMIMAHSVACHVQLDEYLAKHPDKRKLVVSLHPAR